MWLHAMLAAGAFAATPANAVQEREPGLDLLVYWIDEWFTQLPKLVSGQLPNLHRTIEDVDFAEPEDFGLEELIMVRVDGWLLTETAGDYDFRLTSDDGSELYLNGHSVLDNDGLHAATTVTTTVPLEAGEQRLRIEYFNAWGHARLKLEWRPPGAEDFTLVPTEVLRTLGEQQAVSEGKKRIILPLERGAPGRGQALEGVHPAYDLTDLRPDGFEPRVGGMDWLPDGRLVISTWDPVGAVYVLDGVQTGDRSRVSVKRIAAGLAEPLGLCVVDGSIYVLQKQELTQLVDHDGDEVIDEYRCICNGWEVSGNFHEFAFGLLYRDGAFHANLAVGILPGGASGGTQPPHRGHSIRIWPDGRWESVAHGLRTPNGIGVGAFDRIYLTDNQGDWLPASKLLLLEQGAFYGSRAVLGDDAAELEVTRPVAWLPQDEIGNSPTTPARLDDGPYAGQMIHAEVTHGGIKRVFVEEVDGALQGVVFRFIQGLEAGINRLTWGPDGALYVGGIGSAGNWLQEGKLFHGLQRLAYNGESVFEMLAVRAFANGFEVEFTEPLEPGLGWEPSAWFVSDWRYVPTEAYGGPKVDPRELRVVSATVSEDRRRVFLEIDGLEADRVVYLRMFGEFRGEQSGAPWTTEAWYTLNRLSPVAHAVEASLAPGPNRLSERERGEGWRLLFDGETTAGWRGFKSEACPAAWKVEDGALVLRGSGGDLITNEAFDDFELMLDWKIVAGGNSGIFFHVTEDRDFVWQTGPEMQILDTQRHYDGKDPKTSAGANYALHAPPFDATQPVGHWNRVRLRVVGPRVEQWLNGELQCSYERWSDEWNALVAASKFASMPDYGQRKQGHIALQDHGDEVAFRNIKIRDLGD